MKELNDKTNSSSEIPEFNFSVNPKEVDNLIYELGKQRKENESYLLHPSQLSPEPFTI